MNPTPEISIVIVNWRSKVFLHKCIASIRSESRGSSYEIIVVDNASNDGCGQMLSAEFPEVVFIQSEENLGFSGANNLAVRSAHGRILLFLNPDTFILDGAIDHLYEQFQQLPDPGVVGCCLLNSDHSVQTSCVQAFPTIWNQILSANLLRMIFPKSRLWGTAPLRDPKIAVAQVDAVSGACMMISRSVFEQVGGFSSDYFMFAEDTDLCFKTSAAARPNYYVGSAKIIHYGGQSTSSARSNFADVMVRESVGLFFRKYRGPRYSALYRVALSAAAAGRLLLLGLTFPVWVILRDAAVWSVAFKKWLAILCWGIGINAWRGNQG